MEDVSIPEFDFSMPWNSRNVGTTWAIADEGVDQIGCVHTSQGLEFDYVGIIVGDDLNYDPQSNTFFTKWNSYLDANGKKKLKDNPQELNRLVRNVYRILFTRGMKGCFVYFTNKNVERYFYSRVNLGKQLD